MEAEGYHIERWAKVVFPSTKVAPVNPTNGPKVNWCRWSFGGNRLQIKAESRLIADVESALKAVAGIGMKGVGPLLPLSPKQDLLQLLLENEQMRLVVWLYPLDHERRHLFSTGHVGKPPEVCMGPFMATSTDNLKSHLLAYLNTAWTEEPRLAVQLATRFQSLRLTNDVRRLLLMYPEKALVEPDALQILLGPSLPSDVNVQLKVCQYGLKVSMLTSCSTFCTGHP